jgi:hypothetical protein
MWLVIAASVAEAQPACGVVTTDKDCYTPGQQVTLSITNTGCNLINLTNGGPWAIKDSQGNVVYNPYCVTMAIIPLSQGQSQSFSWDQFDKGTGPIGCAYQNRAQVPNGIYQACVDYTDANFTSSTTVCASFEIAKECPEEGPVPTVSGWGLAVLVVLLITSLTIKFSRRRPAPGEAVIR